MLLSAPYRSRLKKCVENLTTHYSKCCRYCRPKPSKNLCGRALDAADHLSTVFCSCDNSKREHTGSSRCRSMQALVERTCMLAGASRAAAVHQCNASGCETLIILGQSTINEGRCSSSSSSSWSSMFKSAEYTSTAAGQCNSVILIVAAMITGRRLKPTDGRSNQWGVYSIAFQRQTR